MSSMSAEIHPQDRDLLGMSFDIIDSGLPFGLRSAPTIFSAVADAVEWMGLQVGISNLLHYLDDFLTWEKWNVDNLDLLVDLCRLLSVPLKWEKLEGPAMFLGTF